MQKKTTYEEHTRPPRARRLPQSCYSLIGGLKACTPCALTGGLAPSAPCAKDCLAEAGKGADGAWPADGGQGAWWEAVVRFVSHVASKPGGCPPPRSRLRALARSSHPTPARKSALRFRTAAAFIPPPLPILGVSPQKRGEKKPRKHHISHPQTVGGLKSMLEQSPCQAQALRVACATLDKAPLLSQRQRCPPPFGEKCLGFHFSVVLGLPSWARSLARCCLRGFSFPARSLAGCGRAKQKPGFAPGLP